MAVSPAELRAALAREGFAVVPVGEVAAQAAANPWRFAAELLGEEPRMVERQPIRPVAGGRSFASTDGYTPLHTDSQLHFGAPPDAQVMVCERPAARGGESLVADAWALCASIEASDPALFQALVHAPRRVPFVFGDVYGPTLAMRGRSVAFTHSPVPPRDAVARALAPVVEAAAREVAVRRGEALVLDNRSCLHGRRAFADPGRSFIRLLVWLDAPLRPHARFQALAEAAAARTRVAVEGAPEAVRARFGLGPTPRDEVTDRRLRAVLDMLRGGAPGVIAAREKIPEPELYVWRDAALAAAARALGSLEPPEATAAALDEALARRSR